MPQNGTIGLLFQSCFAAMYANAEVALNHRSAAGCGGSFQGLRQAFRDHAVAWLGPH